MSIDIIPKSFWSFPSKSLLEDDDWTGAIGSSGLSVSEDDKHIYIEAHMPGIEADNIEITYHKGELWLRGSKTREEDKKKYYRMATNSFSYRLAVPGDVDEKTEPQAAYKNGVLTVTFNRLAEAQPKKISISKS
jgi:HSP20 family protein